MKTLFGLESEEALGYQGTTDITAEDVIEAVTLESEIAEEVKEIEDTFAVAAQAEMVVAQLNEGIEADKAALESDEITASTARISTLHLQSTAAILGLPTEQFAVSTESIENSPKTVLTVSMEAKDGVVKKVIKTIKDVLAKAMVAIKKTGIKILTAVSRIEKSAASLVEKLNKAGKPEKEEFDESTVEKIKSKYAISAQLLNGGKVNASLITKLTDISKNSKETLSAYEKVVNSKDTIEVAKGFDDLIKSVKVADVKNIKNLVDGVDFGNPDKATVLFIKGNTVKVLSTNEDNKISYSTYNAKTGIDKKTTVDFISASDAASFVKSVETVGKNIKDVNDLVAKIDKETKSLVDDAGKDYEDIIKIVEESEKDVEVTKVKKGFFAKIFNQTETTIKKEKVKTEIKTAFNLTVKSISNITPKLTLDTLVSNYQTSKDALWLGNVVYKVHGSEED